MIRANVPTMYRYRCFLLAVEIAMILDSLVVVELDGIEQSRIKHFSGHLPKFAENLKTWGECGVVTIKTSNWPAVADRSVTCLMGGYVPDATGDTYKMYDPVRNVLYRTRDVIWMKRTYFEKTKVPPADPYDLFDDIITLQSWGDSDDDDLRSVIDDPIQGTIFELDRSKDRNATDSSDSEDDDPEGETITAEPGEEEIEPDPGELEDEDDTQTEAVDNRTDEENAEEEDGETPRTRSGRRVRNTKDRRDNTDFAFNAYEYSSSWTPSEEKFHRGMRELRDFAMLKLDMPSREHAENELSMVGATGDSFEKTQDLKVMKYAEAMDDPRREKVNEGIKVEHDKFVKYNVWKEIDETEALRTDRILDTTCAIKPKANGDMRSRVVIRGFQQKPGLQYNKDDLSAPVINLITIRVGIVLMCMASWYAHIVDVEGAFLIVIYCPPNQSVGVVIYLVIDRGTPFSP